jgi:hypothetical protein
VTSNKNFHGTRKDHQTTILSSKCKEKITKIQLEILFGSHDVYAPFTKKTHILNGENIKKN